MEAKPPVLDVGLTLREARESQGMSVHDVAERIKFAPKQIEALEANDFGHLPEPAFLRGFVRSYARTLQLDEASLIAALPSAEPALQAAAKAQRAEVDFPNLFSMQRINLVWFGGALAVAVLLGLFLLLQGGETTVKPSQTVVEPMPLPAVEMPASAVAETEGKPEVPAQAEPKAAEVAPASEARKPVESKPVLEAKKPVEIKPAAEPKKPVEVKAAVEPKKALPEPKKVEPAKPVAPVVKALPQISPASAPAAAEAAKPAASDAALKRRPLHFVFNAESWAEVIDGKGAILLSRNNAAGTEKWIGGPHHEPYDISIANPANVKLYYRGREVDLTRYAAKPVAHLKVE